MDWLLLMILVAVLAGDAILLGIDLRLERMERRKG